MKNYTETATFKNEIVCLKKHKASKEFIKKYISAMSQFDENGCEVGTDYSNVVLAYPHPIM
jgi:hypothetical protein